MLSSSIRPISSDTSTERRVSSSIGRVPLQSDCSSSALRASSSGISFSSRSELALFVEREAALVVAGGPFLDRDRPAFRVVPRPELGVAQLFPFEVFVVVPGKVSDPSFAFEYQQMIHDFVHEIAVV